MITDIQRFSLNDGPGIRTTVFFKGCPLTCAWCHNPESLRAGKCILRYPNRCIGCGACVRACPTGARKQPCGQADAALCTNCGRCAEVCYAGALLLSGQDLTAEQIFEEISQDIPYYQQSGGGVTLSGGECLTQPELCAEILKLCKDAHISTAIETCLHVNWETIESLLPLLDCVMLDVKLADPNEHKRYTGVSNQKILDNLSHLNERDIPLIVRTPVIPGVNDAPEKIAAIAQIVCKLKHLMRYELLNFNPLGKSKYEAMDMPYAFRDAMPLPAEKMAALADVARAQGIDSVFVA